MIHRLSTGNEQWWSDSAGDRHPSTVNISSAKHRLSGREFTYIIFWVFSKPPTNADWV